MRAWIVPCSGYYSPPPTTSRWQHRVVEPEHDAYAAGPVLGRPVRAVLGLPSLAMGVVPLLAPRWTADLVGLPDHPAVPAIVRVVGLRELVVALDFLRARSPHWLWGFVAQDASDLPVLVRLTVDGRAGERPRLRRTLVLYALMAAVDVTAAISFDVSARRCRRPANPRPRSSASGGCA